MLTVDLIGRKGDDIYYRNPGANEAEGHVSINLKRIRFLIF